MLLGIDSGGTAVKVAVYAEDGTCLGQATSRPRRITEYPRWGERDMDESWHDCAQSVRRALSSAGLSGADVDAVGICGHGDGLYLVDENGRPVRRAVLATDSRTTDLVATWRSDGLVDELRSTTGLHLAEPSPAALYAWLARYEPDVARRARWLLGAKDWLRLCLTGEVGTDYSEGIAGFGCLDGSDYASHIADLLGIPQVMDRLPPMAGPTDIAGTITRTAAAECGLRPGTPAVYGTHDVVAGALGAGVMRSDRYCVVAGTWGVNEVLADERIIDAAWQSRRWVRPGQWLHMAASPASTSNLDWLLHTAQLGGTDLEQINDEVSALLDEPIDLLYFPFLYGSPYGAGASAAFLGLTGWHTPAHLVRAVFQGVVFNHLTQLDALRDQFGAWPVRLTGGGARSPVWAQLLADAADAVVEVPDVDETGCWGAALCAAVGTGRRGSLEEAADMTVRIAVRYQPCADRHARLVDGYARYLAVLDRVREIWPLLSPTP